MQVDDEDVGEPKKNTDKNAGVEDEGWR